MRISSSLLKVAAPASHHHSSPSIYGLPTRSLPYVCRLPTCCCAPSRIRKRSQSDMCVHQVDLTSCAHSLLITSYDAGHKYSNRPTIKYELSQNHPIVSDSSPHQIMIRDPVLSTSDLGPHLTPRVWRRQASILANKTRVATSLQTFARCTKPIGCCRACGSKASKRNRLKLRVVYHGLSSHSLQRCSLRIRQR